jgi:L-aminopeptidase/D-esterase-like protein
MLKIQNAITDVPGIKVGHAQDDEALTGCTVVLCESGAVGGIDQRGNASSTRQADALNPAHINNTIHGILLSGGSAFGLNAASGVVRYLEEKEVGFEFGPFRIPTVPTAILFDLGLGKKDVRPDDAMGYQACLNATDKPSAEGNAGAGAGATVGKILGLEHAMKSGIGTAGMEIGDGVRVGAIVAVNAFGDVVDPSSGKIVAGARKEKQTQKGAKEPFADSMLVMKGLVTKAISDRMRPDSTVIGVVATNAKLDKLQTTKVAQLAQNGVVRTVRPANTMGDGDTMFAMATGEIAADANIVGAYAAEVVAEAILSAVRAAKGAGGLPSTSDL